LFLTNLSKRERIFFFLAAAAIVLSLIGNFFLKPISAKWDLINGKILNKEIELKRKTKYLNQKDRVRSVYQEYNEYAKEKLSDEEALAALLSRLEEEAGASGINVIDVRPKPTKDLSFYKKYTLELTCETTIEKCIDFVYNLQKSPQSIRVEMLNLTSPGKDKPLLNVRMAISTIQITQ